MVKFYKAQPIWLKELSKEMNITAGFRSAFKSKKGIHQLRITGASVYRIFLNGIFLGHGPARCGHGYYRMDEWKLPVQDGENLIAIEVAGYNANSFVYLDQPSFLQAEVVVDNNVISATGFKSFAAYHIKERIKKVQRYSFQRTFVEAYKFSQQSADWFTKINFSKKTEPIEILKNIKLVGRGVPYPAFETIQPIAQTASGTVTQENNPKLSWGREWTGAKPDFKAFPKNAGTLYPLHELQKLKSNLSSRKSTSYDSDTVLSLKTNEFKILDLGTNLTGFIGLHIECDETLDLYLSFDEIAINNGDVSLTRYGCANILKYTLKKGGYNLESIEPYTFKYLKLIALNGSCRISGVYLREFTCPDSHRGRFASSDSRLSDLFEAARQTFRQNSVDIFMDCPGRERAGWLCDSFFTARAERDLCGKSPIEYNFFENYLLPKKYPYLAKGMLPMCYPSDHPGGRFIPNWAMWFTIELEEFLGRTDDMDYVSKFKQKTYDLIDYFKPFLNSDGLLESLDSWVFIEWSASNKFVQDVNYPSNMLYAGMLDSAGRLFDDKNLLKQARGIRKTIQKQSFDGEFFVDNAVRNEDGNLEVTRNRTETCQYYAFFFDVATPKSHPDLWKKLCTDFGPDRDSEKQYSEIHPSNAFIGFFLRLDILSRYDKNSLILDQLYKNYHPMAEATGTLWEHKNTEASCNHGFASNVAHIIYRDVLGIHLDYASKTVEFRIPDIDLEWCEGHIPVGNDWIKAKWVRDGDKITHRLSVPKGFKTKIIVSK